MLHSGNVFVCVIFCSCNIWKNDDKLLVTILITGTWDGLNAWWMQFELPMDRKQYYLAIIYNFFSCWYVFSWRLAAKEIMILKPSKYPSLAAINCQVNTFSWQLKAAKLITFLAAINRQVKFYILARTVHVLGTSAILMVLYFFGRPNRHVNDSWRLAAKLMEFS